MFGTRIDDHMRLEDAWVQYSSKISEIMDMVCRFVKKEEMLENAESAYILAKSKELCDESMIIGGMTVKQMLKIDDAIKKIGDNENNAIHRYDNLQSEIDRLKENQKKILEKLDLILDKRNEKK